jgi:phosphopentomutase
MMLSVRAILIVLDSVGIGEAPDAKAYDDIGCATLPHLARAVGGLKVPHLQRMGLGNITPRLPEGLPINGVPHVDEPMASHGAMKEVSEGKDTITGHWELAGLEMCPGFNLFPPDYPSFPDALIQAFQEETGRAVIGNKAASGTAVIEELGPQHMEEGAFIVYTSADSVFQIAAHEQVVPLNELYEACESARKLCNPHRIGRVIARPFVGTPGDFTRTRNRRDYAFKPSEPTILERLTAHGVPVYAVGKITDIYAHRGITESDHTGDTKSSQEAVERFTRTHPSGLIFANFIDFDMVYGHRRDPVGYAKALEQTDEWLGTYLDLLQPDDLLIITADHGNDPTFKGTDHTREYVPLLVYQQNRQPGQDLGIREGFYDVAQSLASFFGIDPIPRGKSFL